MQEKIIVHLIRYFSVHTHYIAYTTSISFFLILC